MVGLELVWHSHDKELTQYYASIIITPAPHSWVQFMGSSITSIKLYDTTNYKHVTSLQSDHAHKLYEPIPEYVMPRLIERANGC